MSTTLRDQTPENKKSVSKTRHADKLSLTARDVFLTRSFFIKL